MNKLLIILFLLSSSLSAFTFDIWESSISLNKAISIAKQENIPLAKDAVAHVSKEFHQKLLYLNKAPNNRVFYYKSKLLGEFSRVDLYFTEKSKKLYKIKIRWNLLGKKHKDFKENLYKLLDTKYGNRDIVIPSSFGEFVLFEKREWTSTKNTTIQTKSSTNGIEVVYIDTVELINNEDEKKTKERKKELEFLKKDSQKF